jgi:hypothetical protein
MNKIICLIFVVLLLTACTKVETGDGVRLTIGPIVRQPKDNTTIDIPIIEPVKPVPVPIEVVTVE